jgi:hypothetical protein
MTKHFNSKRLVDGFIPVILLSIVLFSVVLAGCGKPPAPAGQASSGQAARLAAYTSKIELSHLGLAKGENYLGDSVYYVEGKAKNGGDQAIQRVELTFKFKDSLGQVILLETRRAVDYKGGGKLVPQAVSNFQVGFEKLPKDWNYSLPDVEVTGVVFN